MSHSREPTTHLLCKSKYTFFGIFISGLHYIMHSEVVFAFTIYSLYTFIQSLSYVYFIYVRLEEQSIYTAIH